jgi:hypothetical protein
LRVRGIVLLVVVASAAVYRVPERVAGLIDVERSVLARQPGTLSRVSEPRAGEEVLPTDVRGMLAMLRAAHAESFRYSKLIAGAEALRQRLIEGAYPIRARDDAAYYLSRAPEPLPAGCRVVARKAEFVLAACR